ncbi:Prephenate dehydratase-domain-containing protein [Mycena rebaudengoi]|nr:Prephenate dehydratase-domain-containing protein [Mycena rebaudengoi]
MHEERLKVAFLGPLGTYSHQAAYDRFGGSVEYHESGTITDVFDAVSSRVAQVGVIPQENSIFGTVVETYDALRKPDLGFICGEIVLEVRHCLLVRRGVKFQEIQRVLSHEQALGQCRAFLAQNLASASLVKMVSTAAAAQALLTTSNAAAICSKHCATVFDGLEILAEGIQDQNTNFTRFYVLAASEDVKLPFASTSQTRCLLRLYSPNPPASITQLLATLAMAVSRIDRRPQLEEVERAPSVGDPATWRREIEQAMERVRASGGQVELLGVW